MKSYLWSPGFIGIIKRSSEVPSRNGQISPTGPGQEKDILSPCIHSFLLVFIFVSRSSEFFAVCPPIVRSMQEPPIRHTQRCAYRKTVKKKQFHERFPPLRKY